MAERPVECSQCKKPVKVTYKEIVDDSTICSEMCADCPLLSKKFPSSTDKEKEVNPSSTGGTDVCCGNCHTSLDAVRMGNPLGCRECYKVFSEAVVSELIQADKLPITMRKNMTGKKNQPLHLGKAPNASGEIAPANKLTALHEALNEALKKENYEQAAWIRDQIKALMEKSNETTR